MIEKIKELIDEYELKLKGTNKQFDEELLKLDPKDMASFKPSKASILFGYKECYEEVTNELKKLVQEVEAVGN